MPTINVQNLIMLPRAILESKANNYKTNSLLSSDVPYVFNALNDAASIPGLLDGADAGDIRLRRFMATIAGVQFRFQERDLRDRLGRSYALLDVIPRQFREELQERQRGDFLDLPVVVPQQIGLTVQEFILIGFGIIGLLRTRFAENFTISDELRNYAMEVRPDYDIRQAQVLFRIIDTSKQRLGFLRFVPEQLVVAELQTFTLPKIQQYLNHMARTKRQLQLLLSRPEYNVGYISNRLNPLERYPILQLTDKSYVVPNLRFLDLSLSEALHFMLQDHYPNNRYNRLRGYTQEVYLRSLIQTRLPELVIIPELSYQRRRQEVSGPDLTVIDRRTNQLIVVESKAKRMRVATRVEPGTSALIEDLNAAFEALERLPQKIDELYAGIPEYEMYQDAINLTQGKPPIAVVVLGEGVYLLPELVDDYLRADSTHWLNQYSIPYCLMQLDSFEDAVEVAAAENGFLYDILAEYIRISREGLPHEHTAEAFHGRDIEKQFTNMYTRLLFQHPY